MRNDLTIYSNFAHEWWQADGPNFRSLQNLTPFRLSLIAEMVGDLKGKSVLDLGCGGGLISVPLLNSGALVTGIDMSAESIEVARQAAGGRGRFIVGDICAIDIPDQSIDCVLIADVLDHIPHYAKVLREASRVLRDQGTLFVGTLNRTPVSHFFTVLLGESLGFIPKGTHDSKLFIKPQELIEAASAFGLQHLVTQGEWPVFLQTILKGAISLRRSRSTSIAYSAAFRKGMHAK